MALRIIIILAVTLNLWALSTALPPDVVFKMMHPELKSPVSPLLESEEADNPLHISQPCWDALNQTVNITIHKLLNGSMSPKVLDSFGKPGAGILAGNINMLGHFDECESVPDFKYCLASFNLSGEIPELPIPLLYGLCVPRECSDYDVYQLGIDTDTLLPGGRKLPLETVVCTEYPHHPFTWQFALTVTFFSALFIVVVVSSLYHVWYHSPACHPRAFIPLDEQSTLGGEESIVNGTNDGQDEDVKMDDPKSLHAQRRLQESGGSTMNKLLFSFALPRNLPKLLSTESSEGSIDCLHGIRVISMLWVILGHVFSIMIMVPLFNPVTGTSWLSRYGFMTVANALFSVDSFFVLSGLLVTYLTLKAMKRRNGRIPWRWFYFHRYWRLTPALAVITLFWLFIMPYLGHGPLAQSYGNRGPCQKYWWTNILYINNFYPTKGESGCMPWLWYLANDMQFFAISPLILIPLYHIPWLGLCLIALLCLASCAVTGTLVGVNSFGVTIMEALAPSGDPNEKSFSDVVYFKPYCRITPYLVGMVLGYIIHKYQKMSIKMRWPIAVLGWIVACGVGYTCIYCVYGNYNGHVWGVAASAVYEALCRFAWGAALCWIIFACHYGYGGWVNSLLSYGGWAPLSRLTYCAYLMHPVIMFMYMTHMGTATYMSLALFAFYFAGISLVSYGCAAIFSLMVEFPLVSLEKLFLPRA